MKGYKVHTHRHVTVTDDSRLHSGIIHTINGISGWSSYNTDGTINSNRHTGHDRMEKTNYTQTRRMWYITFLLHMIVSLVRPHNSRVRHRIASVRWISAALLPTLILSHILMTPLQAQIALIGS